MLFKFSRDLPARQFRKAEREIIIMPFLLRPRLGVSVCFHLCV